MPTGACGINCDVCQLNLLDVCATCGSGRSDVASRKSAAQVRILGHPCAILECARLNHIDYCPRDCVSFPCDNFTESDYPYGKSFLDMQARRREQGPPSVDPSGRRIEIDPSWWDALVEREIDQIANFTLTQIDPGSGLLRFKFLNQDTYVDTGNRCLMIRHNGGLKKRSMPLLELVVLDYLTRVDRLFPMGKEMVGVDDLTDAHYFTGHNRLRKSALIKRYGDDPKGFTEAGRRLGGAIESLGDAAVRLNPFPRIPVCYLLWLGSDEFHPRLSILFDRSIEQALSSPAIWCLVRLCNDYLIRGN
jgi:hypothetical protein